VWESVAITQHSQACFAGLLLLLLRVQELIQHLPRAVPHELEVEVGCVGVNDRETETAD